LLVVAALVSPVALAATPVWACSCTSGSPKVLVSQADAALIGEVVADRPVADGTIQEVEVHDVFEGVLPPTIQIHASIGSGVIDPCAVLFSGGHEVALVLRADDRGRLVQDACALLSVAELRRVGGRARPPDPDAAQPSQAPPVVGSSSVGEPAGPLGWWQITGLGALGAIALIAAAVVGGRLRAAREGELPPPGVPRPTRGWAAIRRR
jgi:hypothetical protein